MKMKNKPTSFRPCTSFPSWLRPKRIPPQNIAKRLWLREVSMSPRRHFHTLRMFYENITPNFTVTNVQKPPCFLRKFSPDGRFLIAFSSDQTSLEIYRYLGPAAGGELLKDCGDKEILTDVSHKSHIERIIFGTFFRLLHTVNVAPNREQLNRECSLFTDDGRYVIVGSALIRCPGDIDDVYRTNESVTPNPRSPLDDYVLSIIDMEMGILCDTRTFHNDKIFLSHNQGLYIYGQTLAVLSVQHQTIHIFKITSEGKFVDVLKIGRVCYEDDDFVLSARHRLGLSTVDRTRVASSAYEDGSKTIYSLKHRLLVFLYKRACQESEEQQSPKPLLKFYRSFDKLFYLRMWKMQLLGEDHLLIKYSYEDVVTLRTAEPNGQKSLFVVYNMLSTNVLAVYENTSPVLLHLFEQFMDFFRNARLSCETKDTCSPSNNIWARLIHERYKATIVSAKGGGIVEATKRLLGQLPISAQSFSASPYLDLSLFSYDDKWVSSMERPKNCADHPIRFHGRDSGLVKLSIHASKLNAPSGSNPSSDRRLVAFTFHPTDPFIISVQRTNDDYIVSFHLRHIPSD